MTIKHKQPIAKLKICNKQNKIYFMVAGRTKKFMGSDVGLQMFSMDYMSGKMWYFGPVEKLP